MKKTFFPTFCMLAMLQLLPAGEGLIAGVIYVKEGNPSSAGGSSWTDAKGDVQQALNAAFGGDSVFVAAGTYPLTSDVTLKEGVHLFGGFAGNESYSTERIRADQNGNGLVEAWEYANVTVLLGNFGNRILTQAAPFTTTTVIDGFTISQGKADYGGGVNLKAGAILQSCIISRNEATSSGGGAYLTGATMQGCLITDNKYLANGGGIYASTSATVHGCKVQNNGMLPGSVKIGDLLGGGIVYNVNSSTRTANIVSIEELSSSPWSEASASCNAYAKETYSDWSLPTNIQLQQIYIAKAKLNEALSGIFGAQPFESTSYWSSTEEGARAYGVFFDTGYAGSLSKTASINVRATRSEIY
ncbi:MAG: DUF1566 domain-containing protein [Prevotellaceae bacterium]|jgi:hypothetical protein|nr:DUF1566 domain-containing protein [Prevotellaceae bacterium]